MSNIIDLTGQKFGRWTVLERGENVKRETHWICRCECGKVKSVSSKNLRNHKTESCGCLHAEQIRASGFIKKDKRIYRIYSNIKSRCCNPKVPCYEYYGGRGIKMSSAWKDNPRAFIKWSKENGYSDDLTIDRIDNNGDYSPENCRWITLKEQASNTRRNVFFEVDGIKYSPGKYAEKVGEPYRKIYYKYITKPRIEAKKKGK